MLKRLLITIGAALLCLMGLCACSASSGIVGEYIMALDDMDFSRAYQSIYKFNSASISEEDYLAAYKKLVTALAVTDISIPQYKIASDDEGDYLVYTAELTTKYSEKPFTYEYTARIVSVGTNTGIEYGENLILPCMQAGDRIMTSATEGSRGEIFTSDGELLAENSYADTVYIYVPEVESINTTLSELSGFIEFDFEKIKKAYETAAERDYGTVLVKAYPRGSLTEKFRADVTAIKGIRFDDSALTALRYYPMAEIAAHVTGYLTSPSDDELKALTDAGYPADIKIGATALEASYEEQLRGQDGFAIQVIDANGAVRETVYEDKVSPGLDLRTSINAQYQRLAYYALSSELKAGQAGCVVIMDGDTGFVEALASCPSFDSNLFSFPIEDDVWQSLTGEESGNPLFSRATRALYPPGSSLKPFTAVPAIETGAIDPAAEFPYTITNNKWIPPNETWIWPSINRDRATPGVLNLVSAMRSSDNIYFAWAALETGEEKFMEYMKKVGIGEAYPFDIPLASSNLINKKTEMTRKLLSDMGFGQGEILITPVQLCAMYTAFLNNGDILEPQLVNELCKTEGLEYAVSETHERKVLKEGVIQQSTIKTLMPALIEVVKTGTAHALYSDKYTVAAKTGTPKIGSGDNKKEINWVVAFWPKIEHSKIIVVMVESEEDEGGSVKLAIAKHLTNPADYGFDTSGEND